MRCRRQYAGCICARHGHDAARHMAHASIGKAFGLGMGRRDAVGPLRTCMEEARLSEELAQLGHTPRSMATNMAPASTTSTITSSQYYMNVALGCQTRGVSTTCRARARSDQLAAREHGAPPRRNGQKTNGARFRRNLYRNYVAV